MFIYLIPICSTVFHITIWIFSFSFVFKYFIDKKRQSVVFFGVYVWESDSEKWYGLKQLSTKLYSYDIYWVKKLLNKLIKPKWICFSHQEKKKNTRVEIGWNQGKDQKLKFKRKTERKSKNCVFLFLSSGFSNI